MNEHREFYTIHLPHLVAYVVPVVQSKNKDVELGSGVLVRAGDRHFVATAKHCIDADVRVVRSVDPFQRSGETATRELRILNRGWHDTLDLGYLEIADPGCAEMGWDQLSNDKIVGGMAQVVGYPVTLVIPTQEGKKLTNISLCAGTFGTTLTDETLEKMTFDYPKIGVKYDERTGEWNESPFPKTPKGFSGGAIFGVTKKAGLIEQTEYKLLGIQYAWNEVNSVFAVPIKRWKELLEARGLAP